MDVIFPRWGIPKPAEPGNVAGIERLWLETPQGPVEAWLLLGDGVSAAWRAPLVVFAHGNGELTENPSSPRRIAPATGHGHD